MNVIEKVKTGLWFLNRPIYWKQLLLLTKRKIYGDDDKNKKEALEYCQSRGMQLDEFMKKVGIHHLEYREEEKDTFRTALKKEMSYEKTMGGAGNIDLLYSLVSSPNVNTVLETGVAYGWSSLAILSALKKKRRGHLVSIDMPYPKMDNEDVVGMVVPDSLKKPWTLIREADITGIRKGINNLGKLDLCHYDSDKSYRGRSWAYPILWKALSSGGYFISDDIQDNTGFKEFCEEINIAPSIINYDGKYLGILIKP